MTVVNLYIGKTCDVSENQTYTVDLILTSPYATPEGNLLVLRSRPDVEPIDGTADVVESSDVGVFEALTRLPVDPVDGTFAVAGKGDTASFAGVAAPRGTTGVWETSESADTVNFSGPGYEGIVLRVGTLSSTEAHDVTSIAGSWTMQWVATMDATEPGDAGSFSAWYLEYTGPGFLNTTERRDTASFSGRQVYDVTGEAVIAEATDVSTIVARSREEVDADSVDTIVVTELLELIPYTTTLRDRFFVSDLLEEDMGMAFANTVVAGDALASHLRVSQALSDVLIAQDYPASVFSGDLTDTLFASEYYGITRPFDVVDRVILRDGLASGLAVSGGLEDVLVGADALSMVFYEPIGDVVLSSDSLDSQLIYIDALNDATRFKDVLSAVLDISGVLLDAVNVADSSSFAFGLPGHEDTVLVSDALDSQYALLNALDERVLLNDALGAELAISDPLVDTVAVADVLGYGWVAEFADAVQITDTLVSTEFTIAPLVDSWFAVDALVSDLTVYAPTLADTVRLADALSSVTNLQLVGVLSDTVLFGDALSEMAQTVYVVNAETGAVSTYQFTPTITGMAEYHGVLYLSGPDGLYALDAEQDDDGAVVWTLRTGFSNLGTDKLKRVRDVNFQARTEADLTFQVVSDRYGKKQEWNYRLPALDRESYRDGVVKPGKGIQSVYWQFAAKGIGPAEIDQLRLSVEPLSRRR